MNKTNEDNHKQTQQTQQTSEEMIKSLSGFQQLKPEPAKQNNNDNPADKSNSK